MKFHHIGYLTNNLKNAINEFKKIEYAKKTNIINDNLLKVKVVFIKNTSNLIELVKPHKKNYGLIKIIKNKNYAYHFAYKVKNINQSIKKLLKHSKNFLKENFTIKN